MRIGRLFAVSMLSVTVLTVVLGAGVLVPQYLTFASKTEAIKAVEAYGTVLAVGQQVAGYRAPYVGPLFQEVGRDARADGDSREGRAGGRCSIRESTDRRRRAQRWRGDRPGSQSGGGETGRGSHRERSRDGAADERARSRRR